jgi:DNA (cytosine-5)-methyltransferase 1
MRYVSVCSGIEAATVAWHELGWVPLAFSEIEPFPSAVLAHHYPNVPNLGDMTKHEEWNLGAVDLLVGGTPCQSFSVAGLRKGLADPRGNLMLTYLAIAERERPKWIVWENVPGVLSSERGRDFGTFLGALGELGYGWAYRVLDAQWFGVAQRRRRVFVVGYLGDWRRAAAVLFESESVCRDTAPRRETRKTSARSVENGSRGGGQPYSVANCLTQRMHKGINTTLDEGQTPVLAPAHFRKSRRAQSTTDHETWVEDDATNTLNCFDVGDVRATDVVAQPVACATGDRTHALTTRSAAEEDGTGRGTPIVPVVQPVAMQVRRLTPTECERLQGFPDGYTNIPWRKKPESPDGPRYKALGNSMAVPVMRWIGQRIQKTEDNGL